MTRKAEVQRQLQEMHRELELVVAILDTKLLWLSTIESSNLQFDCPIRDGDVSPTVEVRRIRASSEALRQLRPHLENEMRRAFLNDLYLVASRHMILAENILNGLTEPRPEFSRERREAALEALNRFLAKADKKFLDFVRRLRNTVVHYEGRHNLANPMNDTLLGRHIYTTDDTLGMSITLSLPQLYHLHSEICRVLDPPALLQHPQMAHELAALKAREDR